MQIVDRKFLIKTMYNFMKDARWFVVYQFDVPLALEFQNFASGKARAVLVQMPLAI